MPSQTWSTEDVTHGLADGWTDKVMEDSRKLSVFSYALVASFQELSVVVTSIVEFYRPKLGVDLDVRNR